MVLRNINNQRAADDFAGYMSLTIVFTSLLSVFFMVLPILIAAYNGQSKFYSIDSDRSIWSPSSSRKNSNNKPEIQDNDSSPYEPSEPQILVDTELTQQPIVPHKRTLSSDLDVIQEEKVSFNNVPDFLQPSPPDLKMTALIHTLSQSQSPYNSLTNLPENTPTPPLQTQPTLIRTESKTKTNTDTVSSSSTEQYSQNTSTNYSHFEDSTQVLGDTSNPSSSASS